MRVLYIVSLFPCWSETFIVREIHELISRGVEVRILSLKTARENLIQSDAQSLHSEVIYPAAFWANLRNVHRILWRKPWKSLRSLAWIISGLSRKPGSVLKSIVVWWRSLGTLERIMAWRPQMIHAHWATYPSTSAMMLSDILNVPYSFTAHAHDIFLEQHLLKRKLNTADFVITISEFNRRFLMERIDTGIRDKLHVVHCGIDLKAAPYKENGRDTSLLLAVGRLDEIKGFATLVDACGILLKAGVNFRCEIIGEGPLRKSLRQLIDKKGLAAHVRLQGAQPQEEVRKHLYATSVFVLPSTVTRRGNMDGIPVALMEAMACGAPVVSTTVSGIPELVEDGVSGFLVEPNKPDVLAERITLLLSDPDRRAAFARNARNKIEKNFSVSVESEKLLQLFQASVTEN